MRKTLRIVLAAGLTIILVVLYLYGANLQSRLVNTNLEKVDQSAYMRVAIGYYDAHYNWISPRVRMPLYPLMLTLLYRKGMPMEGFFARSKEFTILLSLGLLAGLYPFFRRYLALHSAANLLLITAFSVFAFRASYIQGDLPNYFLSFVGFLLLSRLLVRPSWQVGIVCGVVLGLAHLAKGSILLGLALFLGCVAIGGAITLWAALKGRPQGLSDWRSYRWLVLSAALCVILFVATISPYIINSKRAFGSYLYNVNTNYYMWIDSYEEAQSGTIAHGDRKEGGRIFLQPGEQRRPFQENLPDMPPDQIPSMQKYLREHTLVQMLDREWRGLLLMIHKHTDESYGYVKFVILYLLMALGACILTWRSTLATVRKYPAVLVLWAGWSLAYFALCAWRAPVGNHRRYLLTQFVPFVFTAAYIIQRQGAELRPLLMRGRRLRVVSLVNWLLTALMLVDIYWNLAYRLPTVWGGN